MNKDQEVLQEVIEDFIATMLDTIEDSKENPQFYTDGYHEAATHIKEFLMKYHHSIEKSKV